MWTQYIDTALAVPGIFFACVSLLTGFLTQAAKDNPRMHNHANVGLLLGAALVSNQVFG
jgi:hypothetical protein